jgi:hypothetical protein
MANRNDWQKNIIIPEVARYIAGEAESREQSAKPFPLHKWIHHGLSSQACLFSLLGDFLVKKDYAALKELVALSEPTMKLRGDISVAQFEYEDRDTFAERQGQPTSIDLFLGTDKGEKVFIEFKFTESEFGTCSVYEDGDCDGANPRDNLSSCYLQEQKRRMYMNLMEDYHLLGNEESCPFNEFYQAYRLLLFSLKNNGYFLLIHDERNPAFLTQINGVTRGKFYRFKRLLTKEISDNMFILSIQRIVQYLEQSKKHSWLEEFRRKYL